MTQDNTHTHHAQYQYPCFYGVYRTEAGPILECENTGNATSGGFIKDKIRFQTAGEDRGSWNQELPVAEQSQPKNTLAEQQQTNRRPKHGRQKQVGASVPPRLKTR